MTPAVSYVPPSSFAEFLDRHPRHVEGYLFRQFRLRGADLEDAVHDVYLHLMTLPPGSIHCARQDRIAVFEYRDGCTRPMFLSWLNLIVKHYMLSRRGAASQRLLRQSVISFDDAPEDGTVDDVAALYGLCVEPDQDGWLFIESLLDAAFCVNPMTAYTGAAVLAFASRSEAARFLGLSESGLVGHLKALRWIAEGRFDRLSRMRGPRRKGGRNAD